MENKQEEEEEEPFLRWRLKAAGLGGGGCGTGDGKRGHAAAALAAVSAPFEPTPLASSTASPAAGASSARSRWAAAAAHPSLQFEEEDVHPPPVPLWTPSPPPPLGSSGVGPGGAPRCGEAGGFGGDDGGRRDSSFLQGELLPASAAALGASSVRARRIVEAQARRVVQAHHLATATILAAVGQHPLPSGAPAALATEDRRAAGGERIDFVWTTGGGPPTAGFAQQHQNEIGIPLELGVPDVLARELRELRCAVARLEERLDGISTLGGALGCHQVVAPSVVAVDASSALGAPPGEEDEQQPSSSLLARGRGGAPVPLPLAPQPPPAAGPGTPAARPAPGRRLVAAIGQPARSATAAMASAAGGPPQAVFLASPATHGEEELPVNEAKEEAEEEEEAATADYCSAAMTTPFVDPAPLRRQGSLALLRKRLAENLDELEKVTLSGIGGGGGGGFFVG